MKKKAPEGAFFIHSVIALLARRLAATGATSATRTTGAGALGTEAALRRTRRVAALRGFHAVPLGDLQLLLGDPHLLQVGEDLRRHAFGQVDQAVVVTDADATDELGLDAAFVGDGADDVARLYAMLVAHFDAVRALAGFGGVRTRLAHAFANRTTVVEVTTTFARTAIAVEVALRTLAIELARRTFGVLALGRRLEQQRLGRSGEHTSELQ